MSCRQSEHAGQGTDQYDETGPQVAHSQPNWSASETTTIEMR
ncbi:hypothetical protein [Naasia aerilata]|nr:hypothetical protein [Naasia aerilata]